MLLEQVNHDADRVTRWSPSCSTSAASRPAGSTCGHSTSTCGSLAAAVVEQVGIAYPELSATLSTPEQPLEVWADADKVEQVLTNLVENACKYAEPSQVRVSVERSSRGRPASASR